MKAKRKAKPTYAEKPKRTYIEKSKRKTFGQAKTTLFSKREVKPTVKVSPRQQALMTGFKFSARALESNQEGKLGSSQRGSRLISSYDYLWWPQFLSGGLLMLTGGIPTILSIWVVLIGGWAALLGIIMFGTYAILGLAMITKAYNLRGDVRKDISEGNVQQIQGLVIVPAPLNNVAPTIEINKLYYRTPKGALAYIKSLEPHIIYFLPRSKIIVSVEVVEN